MSEEEKKNLVSSISMLVILGVILPYRSLSLERNRQKDLDVHLVDLLQLPGIPSYLHPPLPILNVVLGHSCTWVDGLIRATSTLSLMAYSRPTRGLMASSVLLLHVG
jgi:hypothetical protein